MTATAEIEAGEAVHNTTGDEENVMAERPTAALSGGSGLIGKAFARYFEEGGYRVLHLVRRPPRNMDEISWDPLEGKIIPETLEGVEIVIHLSGENIGSGLLWTKKKRRKIRESRVSSTRFLAETLSKLKNKPPVLLCASAVGIYGDRGDLAVSESAEPAGSFLSSVCRDWEKAAEPARAAGIRVVHLRLGVVLSREGGMLKALLPLFRYGLGTLLGDGSQYLSWISLKDIPNAADFLIRHPLIEGPVNLTSPHPVTQRDFRNTLAKVLKRPAFLKLPAALIRVFLGEKGQAMLLDSTRALPRKLLVNGFHFKGIELEPTLSDILRKDEYPELIGKIELTELREKCSWFNQAYDRFPVRNPDLFENLDFSRSDLKILAIIGTWCRDSQILLPQLIKILEFCKFPMDRLQIIGVGANRMLPGTTDLHKITRFPTWIFESRGKEMGRMTEKPTLPHNEEIARFLRAGLSSF